MKKAAGECRPAEDKRRKRINPGEDKEPSSSREQEEGAKRMERGRSWRWMASKRAVNEMETKREEEGFPSGQQEKKTNAPKRTVWAWLVGIFWKDSLSDITEPRVDIEEAKNIAGKSRHVSATILFDRNLVYEREQKCWSLSLAVKQMDFGIVNTCNECSAKDDLACKKCEVDKAIIDKISVQVIPKLPAGTTVKRTEGEPWDRPGTVEEQNTNTGGVQFPCLKPWNGTITVQRTEASSVKTHVFGWDPCYISSSAITFTWRLLRWKNGHKFGLNLFCRERELPLNPRRVHLPPKAFSEELVRGQWHLMSSSALRPQEVTFELRVTIHLASIKLKRLGQFVQPAPRLRRAFELS